MGIIAKTGIIRCFYFISEGFKRKEILIKYKLECEGSRSRGKKVFFLKKKRRQGTSQPGAS